MLMRCVAVDVVAGDCPADTAGAQRQGWHYSGCQADGAQRTHRVDQDAEDRLLQTERHDDFLIAGIDDLGVPPSASVDELDGSLASLSQPSASYQPSTVVSFS